MINGSMVCKVPCGLDRFISFDRSTDRRNAMVYRHISFCVRLYGSFKIRTFSMVGLHIGTNSPAVSLNYLLAEAILKSRRR